MTQGDTTIIQLVLAETESNASKLAIERISPKESPKKS